MTTTIWVAVCLFGAGMAYFFVGVAVSFLALLFRELEDGIPRRTIFDRGFRFNRQDILFGFFWPLVVAFCMFSGSVCVVWTILRLETQGETDAKKQT